MVEVKNFHFLKRPFLTKKSSWFFVTLGEGVRASVTLVTKKWFFFKASLIYLLFVTFCPPQSEAKGCVKTETESQRLYLLSVNPINV